MPERETERKKAPLDRTTFGHLVDCTRFELERRVHQLSSMRSATASDLEDILQEIYLRAWQGRERFASYDAGSFFAWTLGIARRIAAEHLRREVRLTGASGKPGKRAPPPRAPPADPAEIAADRELVRTLEGILERRAEEFPIAQSFFLLGQSVRTIACALHLHPVTVRRRLRRELRALRALLASSREGR